VERLTIADAKVWKVVRVHSPEDKLKTHLVLDLAQQFLFANVIDSEGFANSSSQSSLESHHRKRNVICLRLRYLEIKLHGGFL
jgi:hypothetical protein